MRILIAEDDLVSRRVLQATLTEWGYDVVATCDGSEAWQALQSEEAPKLAILDWMMPKMDGVEVCSKVREMPDAQPTYIIVLTAKGHKEDIVTGFHGGADDYVTKPFDREELRVRVQVGVRIVELQRSLAERVKELEEALSQVKQLQGLLPICSYCKKVRDDGNYWHQVEAYITKHSEAQFSHSICPECYENIVEPMLEKMEQREEIAERRDMKDR